MNFNLSKNKERYDEITLKYIAKNKLDRAIKLAIDYSNWSKGIYYDRIIQISGKYHNYIELKNKGEVSITESNIERNKISAELNTVVKKIYDENEELLNENNQSLDPDKSIEKNNNLIEDKKVDNFIGDNILAENIQNVNIVEKTKILIFSCESLEFIYSKSGFKLKNISFNQKVGEIIALVGENAHGKSTLLNVIAGRIKNSNGQLNYPLWQNGGKLKWSVIKSKIAYVSQELPKWHGSLLNNLYYNVALHGIYGNENEKAVEYILHRLGLVSHINKKWNELSGGYKFRFALAKALAWKPQYLILDEPLANLDIHSQLQVLIDIKDLAKNPISPMSVIISSQHLNEIEYISEKVLYIYKGKLKYKGNNSEIGIDRNNNKFELTSNATIAQLEEALDSLEETIIEDNGLYYNITTDVNISSKQIISLLIQHDIDFRSINNISQTIKSLFL